MLMTSEEYRESLRRLSPKVYLGGKLVESVADEPGFAPGVNATGITYDFALVDDYKDMMTAKGVNGDTTNRLLAINRSRQDLLEKLEAVTDGLQLPRRLLVHSLDNRQPRGGLFRVEAALRCVRQGVEV